MNSENCKTDLTRLQRLAALLGDDDSNVEVMTHEQLVQYLKNNKVDLAASEKRFAGIRKKAEARLRLEIARKRRLAAVERAKNIASAGGETVAAVRARVREMIENFGKCDPEQAQVYAREFEKATPEDLLILEEDLTLLEMDSSKDDKSDQQNSS